MTDYIERLKPQFGDLIFYIDRLYIYFGCNDFVIRNQCDFETLITKHIMFAISFNEIYSLRGIDESCKIIQRFKDSQ